VPAVSLAAHRAPAPRLGRERQRPLPLRVVRQHLDPAEDAEKREVRRLIAACGV